MYERMPKVNETVSEEYALAGLQTSADMLVAAARESLPYRDGDTISCIDPGNQEDNGTSPSETWFKVAGGYVIVGLQNLEDTELAGHIGSFPMRGVPGRPHHLTVRNSVGSPADGDPAEWLAVRLQRLRTIVTEHPGLCTVEPPE